MTVEFTSKRTLIKFMSNQQLHHNKTNTDFINDRRVLSLLNLSPKRDQQIFRRAFIHSASFLFVIVCGVCAFLVYHILQPFLSSILYSILAGALLFPFKNHFTSYARYYLRQLEIDSHLLVSGLVFILPLKILDGILESIGPLCIRKWKELLLILLVLPTIEFLQSGVVYRWIITIGYDYFVLFERYIYLLDSGWIILLILIYFFAVLIIYNHSCVTKSILNRLSIPIWLILFIYLSQILPINYRVIVVTVTVILIVVGFVLEQNANESTCTELNQHPSSIFRNFLNLFRRIRIYLPTKSALPTPSSSSTPYFTFVLWSILALKVYQFSWYLIPISIFIIIYKIIKCSLLYTYIYFRTQRRITDVIHRIIRFWEIRHDVFIPLPLHFIIRCLIKGDKKLNHALQNSMDYLISACIIVTLFILLLFGTIFLLIQIQDESIHMIKLTSHFLNETMVFQDILPDKEHISHLMDTIVKKSYLFGRRWITTQVAKVQPPRVEPICCLPLSINPNGSPYMHVNMIGPGSLSNKNLEKQVLQLWENLYTYITNASVLFLSPRNRSRMFYSSANQNFQLRNFVTYMQKDFDFHLNDLYRLIRDNLDLLRTIFDSIWSNTTIIFTLLSTIISLVFTGGFAVLNFFVSFIVFITLLFYLLSHQTKYQPTEWINNLLAIGGASLGKAVNDAVTSVFIASLKIATFYGLYTYVSHTLLGSNLVFLPAVIASICAIVLKSYWAVVPGCLDLWLVQQRPLSAGILLIAQIAPLYVVDTTIYSEVKGGGHQYLTALAIAGGVYYRGIEGALTGPIILCCLLVGIRMYNETMATTLSSNPDQSSLSNLKQRLDRSFSSQSVMTRNDTD